ncbi:oxidoreductase [Salimicrobium jeotgali]|uniref:Oxidoreductase n=2 Tax=Salimicrobium TaxID=351195 RepID=K2GCJ3_9BACI|nr:alpha/beta hydrolase [Salimicrobium jeotgali]AKG04502.2 oxidoreductase [Salimicrobium jeotgali]EKE32713.1 oxidoreductase- hydrolase involved in aromatic ring cleavage [Salimicrobium jeotgali]MBM7695301.1 pimeloyl-ACP methyl ester carboxylesterase [Salimicrobium jeotgali]
MLDDIVEEPVKINYTDEGTGTPIILLHGIPTWSYLYREVIPRLKQDYRVIAPDLLGYGWSDQRDRFDRSIRVQAKMVLRLMDDLGIDKASIAGHDIAGGVGLILSLEAPERIDKMVFFNIVAYDSWPIEDMLMMGHPSKKNKSLIEIEGFLTKAYEDMFSNEEQLTDTFLQGIISPYVQEQGKLSLVRNAAALNTNHTTALTYKLPKIEPPVLLLWGTEDPWQPVETGEQLERDLPDCKLIRLDDAAPWVPQEVPDKFSAEIKAFV